MSFTQDELQALNTIFDQKMAVLQRELERSLNQRMQVLKGEFEQHVKTIVQNLLHSQSRRLSEMQHRSRDTLNQKLEILQDKTVQKVNQESEQQNKQQKQYIENVVERTLAAQLLAFEQLINQRLPLPVTEPPVHHTKESQPDFEAIEVQTEVAWEDLIEMIDKALMERLTALNVSLQSRMQEMERALTTRIRQWRDRVQYTQSLLPRENSTESLTSMQDVFASIEQLEHLIESMQVAMANNSALLANRLYHHQQLPLERAHPSCQENSASLHSSDKENTSISLTEDV
jgi:hypothetical protein